MWVDTCCVDKTDPAIVSEEINSMFRYYQEAEACYIYLDDVGVGRHTHSPIPEIAKGDALPGLKDDYANSQWFTRGWIL